MHIFLFKVDMTDPIDSECCNVVLPCGTCFAKESGVHTIFA